MSSACMLYPDDCGSAVSDRMAKHMQCVEFCIAAVAEVDHMQIQCAEFV